MEIVQAIQKLGSSDIAERGQAAEVLATCGEDISAAVVQLVRASSDADETVREWVVSALEDCGPPREADLPALVSLVAHTDELPAYWAATLTGRFADEGGNAVSAVTALANALAGHSSQAVRQRAAWSLGKMGADATPARPSLEAAVSSNDPRLKRLAERALENL